MNQILSKEDIVGQNNTAITRHTVFSSFLWRFFERTGAQLVRFLVEIILARLLAPSVYGTVALVTVFTNLLNVFIDSGFGNALVQKKLFFIWGCLPHPLLLRLFTGIRSLCRSYGYSP